MIKPGLRHSGSCTPSARVRGYPRPLALPPRMALSLTRRGHFQELHPRAPGYVPTTPLVLEGAW